MKTFWCIALALLLFAQFSCRKDGNTGIGDQRLKDAVNIHPGSYFVYADSATGAEDSFFVPEFTHDIDNGGWEHIQFLLNDIAGNSLAIQAAGNGEKGNDKITLDFVLNHQHYPIFDLLQFEFQDQKVSAPAGSFPPYSFYGTPYCYYPSYEVLGKTYGDVYELETQPRDSSGAFFSGNFHSFYSLHDGLVKFETEDAAQHVVFSLKRSFIVRE